MCVCVGMTALALAPYLSPVAHTESHFNTPTCLGRGSDTALFSHNGGQTVGAGGRRRGGFIGQKEERALMIRLLSPAVSRRRVSVKRTEDRGGERKEQKERQDMAEKGRDSLGLIWWSEESLDGTVKRL